MGRARTSTDWRPRASSIPEGPGVYRFRDRDGRIIYVGKAKNLRSRLSSYFSDPAGLHPRTAAMVASATGVDWTLVGNEVEALQLEYTWIKEFDPRFNVRYRDDKSYPFLAVTLDEEIPRVQVMRGQKRKGARYFGPYSHAWAIRETVDLLLRVFPMRSCSSGVYRRAAQVGRPCLLGYIDKCSAPCVGRISPEEHRVIAEEFCAFMAGRSDPFLRRLERDMREASAAQDYERAARLRDDIGALRRATEKNAVVLGDGTDADVLAIVAEPLEAAVQVFHVRDGRIRGQRGYVVDRVEETGVPELVTHLLQQVYGEMTGEAIPREVLVNVLPDDPDAAQAWLSARRSGPVHMRAPERGDKRTLIETVERNARESLTLHAARRSSDLTTRSQALTEIQEALDLPEAPLRIECIDVSHLQGTETVASLVVFEDGLPRKSDYRRFIVRDVAGANDVASIREVVMRRFRRAEPAPITDAVVESTSEVESTPEVETGPVQGGRVVRRFAYPPHLLVIDGGAPQVAAAVDALEEVGIVDVQVCGLAKRLEEVWLPGQADPVILPRQSEGLYLLQRLRDEAHRFAITHHRQRRSGSMLSSILDEVPGLGEVRRKALMRRFGSLRRLRQATLEELAEVPGIGPATAASLRAVLDRHPATPSVNTATGEVLADDAPADSGP